MGVVKKTVDKTLVWLSSLSYSSNYRLSQCSDLFMFKISFQPVLNHSKNKEFILNVSYARGNLNWQNIQIVVAQILLLPVQTGLHVKNVQTFRGTGKTKDGPLTCEKTLNNVFCHLIQLSAKSNRKQPKPKSY